MPPLFFTPAGTLRAIWRALLFCAACTACAWAAYGLIEPVVVWAYGLVGLRSVSAGGWVEVSALLGAHWIALRKIDKRPWGDVGLDASAARPGIVARGFVLGLLPICVPILALIALGWLVRAPGNSGSATGFAAWSGAAVRVSLFLLPAAFAEELLARGYLFAVIRDAVGWRWSLGLTSLGFALLHVANNGAAVGPLSMVLLAGVFLGAVRMVTGSLYAAWAAHFAWNWAMAVLFHTAVSGYPLEAPVYRYVDSGPKWATGGVWGPEGGILAACGMLAMIGYLVVWSRRNQGN